jgi:hypothetical protein
MPSKASEPFAPNRDTENQKAVANCPQEEESFDAKYTYQRTSFRRTSIGSGGGGSGGGGSDEDSVTYVDSQKHLLEPTAYNPIPNRVPPPIAALAGNIGERHVLVMLGLPCRGKSFTSQRLQRYLRFFNL